MYYYFSSAIKKLSKINVTNLHTQNMLKTQLFYLSWAISSSVLCASSSASFSNLSFSFCTSITHSRAVLSLASISLVKWNISKCSGIGSSRWASAVINVDLPMVICTTINICDAVCRRMKKKVIKNTADIFLFFLFLNQIFSLMTNIPRDVFWTLSNISNGTFCKNI